jgi:NADH:ubiquinone oxidoreductase subunit 5 (subunit L)/multisubunit Na+/H+ antiporter MnhA subunit
MLAKNSFASSGLMANIGKNRLYIDWAYSKFIVLPLEFFAGLLAWKDVHIIDSLATRIASIPRVVGLVGQRYQNGRVPTYTFLTAVGVAAVAIWIISR